MLVVDDYSNASWLGFHLVDLRAWSQNSQHMSSVPHISKVSSIVQVSGCLLGALLEMWDNLYLSKIYIEA